MSYILGFIAADGCVHKRKGRKNSYILSITNKEKCILEKIKQVVRTSASISIKNSGSNYRKEYYVLQICNEEIIKDLLILGILPRKTHNLSPLPIPDLYFADFTRGFFDGDGTVYIYNVNGISQIKAGFVSASFPFIADFNIRLCQFLKVPEKAIHTEPENKTRRRMERYNICFYITDCGRLADFMYEGSPNLYLKRKREIFEKWKSIKRRHYIKSNYPSKIGWHLNQKLATSS